MNILPRIIRRTKGAPFTTPVCQDIDPSAWREHLFGLPRTRWNHLKHKSFWITGAGTGYGRAMSCALAAAGATVFLTGRRAHKLQETLGELEDIFHVTADNCHIVPADLTHADDVHSACEVICSLSENLHGLINNAAVPGLPHSPHPLLEGSLEEWNKVIDTNLRAHWLTTKSIMPHMLKNDSLRVLFITSEAGWASTAGFGTYNVSKSALNNLACSFAEELSRHSPGKDIQINTISPGEARTEMNRASDTSPYSIVNMALLLLSHPAQGPNGKFFHRDGRHLSFCYATPYKKN